MDAPAGTLVFARPGVKRTAFAEEPGTTLVALGGTPGKAYEAHGGEIWMPLHHLYESGEYAEAADRGRELIEAHPEYAGPLYNLACCESLAGRTADAIEHLRLAIDRKEPFRSFAADDSDFDPIRDEPAFKELVSSRVAEQLRANARSWNSSVNVLLLRPVSERDRLLLRAARNNPVVLALPAGNRDRARRSRIRSARGCRRGRWR